ncbi:TPA: hypothetical protein EYP26_06195 [Candidatus Bathyarchaeota archaeon]|nr:hypothetical protein [Candidatus Bathyarchaeota archaeon]
MKTFRDVLLFGLGRSVIVIGCDSAGGIGSKPLDKIKVGGEILGKFTARVALMEVLAVGAKPLCLSVTLSVEPEPSGEETLKGVKEEAKFAGLASDQALIVSSEKNVPVEQTGIGITAVGIALKDSLRIGKSRKGDLLVSVGLPRVGEEVLVGEARNEIANLQDLKNLLCLPFVHEAIPVGSKGILHEANVIAKSSNLALALLSDSPVDIKKSAGPATVILLTVPKAHLNELKKLIKKPIHLIGWLR